MSSRWGGFRPQAVGLLLLGACTLWLVVQNTVLALALLWAEPRKALTVAAVLLKAGAAVILDFWTSPGMPLLAVALVTVALAAPRWHGRVRREEVLHG